MRWYIIRRLVQIVITFFLFLTFTFLLLEAMPGDFGQSFINNPRLTQEQREALRASFGLDRPMHERFFIYMRNLVRGELGISFSNYPRPVIDVIKERAPRTILLFVTATVVSYYVGFSVGKILAWRRGKALEYVATLGGVTLYTVFVPWFALMMIWLFAFTLGWFPIGQFITPSVWRSAPVDANTVFNRILFTAAVVSLLLFVLLFVTRRLRQQQRRLARWGGAALLAVAVVVFWVPTDLARYALDILHHLLLPVLTLALVTFAGTMLLTRNSMLETLREDYIMAARAKGLPEDVIRNKHAARNAMLPVVTAFVFALAATLDGGVITESVFSWPGMGLTLLEAVLVQDIPMVMGALVFIGLLALIAHLVADILYAYLDPRIRYT